jgi:integrase
LDKAHGGLQTAKEFVRNGKPIRESTKQTNRRVAEQMAAARRTQPAKGEVGIRDFARVPTLAEFAEDRFRPFVRATFAAKPKTKVYYENGLNNLLAFEKLAEEQSTRSPANCSKVKQRDRVLTAEEEKKYLRQAAPLLGDVASVLMDCALRPEECFRLKPVHVQQGNLEIPWGKTENAVRKIPDDPAR